MFKNRKDAGKQLAAALYPYKHHKPLILGIPRGGVEVAFYVAKYLQCSFSVVISRKLGHPHQPELAFGAIAEDKSLYLNPMLRKKLTREMIETVIRKEEKEIKRRVARYRNNEPLPSIAGRIVILVDDGIATGATLFSVITLCQKQRAAHIVVAAPVASKDMERKLRLKVDDVIILETPVNYRAVSQAYESFSNLSDEDVAAFLSSKNSFSKTGY